MRLPKARITMRHLMFVIAAFAFGLAICPREKPYLGLLPPVAWWLASLKNWSVIFLVIILLVFCALIEIVFGEPLPAWIYVPIAVVLSGPLWPERPIKQRPERLILLICVNALILGIFLIPWTTRKPFLRDLYSIKPGMDAAEVRKIMAHHKCEYVGEANCFMFRHSNEPMFNADVGIVTIEDGKVIDVRFDPD